MKPRIIVKISADITMTVLLTMIGSAVSGVMLSRYALAFLPIEGGRAFARTLHIGALCR